MPIFRAGPHAVADGRLTLSATLPVTTADVTAATTLYYLPYIGNQVGLYNESAAAWFLHVAPDAGVQLDISALVADTNYDIFLSISGSDLVLTAVAWTDFETRATALVNQDGVPVLTGSLDERYVGTIRITSVTGQCEDSLANRFVWNMNNRVQRGLERRETVTASWSSAQTTTPEQANDTVYSGVITSKVDVVVGQPDGWISLTAIGISSSTGASRDRSSGIGEDVDTAFDALCLAGNLDDQGGEKASFGFLKKHPPIGYHSYIWLEHVDDTAVVWLSTIAGGVPTADAGIFGYIVG